MDVTPLPGLTLSSLAKEGIPLAADAQHQGAEDEAREKLHGAERKVGSGGRGRAPHPLWDLHVTEPLLLIPVVLRRLRGPRGNPPAGPHSEPQPSILTP